MKKRYCLLPITALTLLPACSLFEDKDPREGAEALDACVQRVSKDALDITAQDGAMFVPTFTYDITKVSLEDLQELTVAGSDETAGSRNMAATNETSTAVAQFMEEPVDEKGAFFMGRDPALYRVRGGPVVFEQIIPSGCERQKSGMRLTSYSAKMFEVAAENEATSLTGSEDQSENENTN